MNLSMVRLSLIQPLKQSLIQLLFSVWIWPDDGGDDHAEADRIHRCERYQVYDITRGTASISRPNGHRQEVLVAESSRPTFCWSVDECLKPSERIKLYINNVLLSFSPLFTIKAWGWTPRLKKSGISKRRHFQIYLLRLSTCSPRIIFDRLSSLWMRAVPLRLQCGTRPNLKLASTLSFKLARGPLPSLH